MKKSNLIIIFALLIVIAAFILFGFQSLTHNPVQQINNNLPQAKITINQKTFDVWLAKTDAEHEHGLSGWQKLQDNQGMLFIFNKPSIQSFWMKDMNFDLDIIFISDNKITEIAKYLPAPRFIEWPATYITTQPADQVLEVNAGTADSLNWKIGDKILYQSN